MPFTSPECLDEHRGPEAIKEEHPRQVLSLPEDVR